MSHIISSLDLVFSFVLLFVQFQDFYILMQDLINAKPRKHNQGTVEIIAMSHYFIL